MMYSDIEVPSQGDGRTMVLIGHGYFRGNRLAEIHFRILAALIDAAIFFTVYLVLNFIASLYWKLQSGRVSDLALVLTSLPLWTAISATFVNIVWMQSKTGQSFGKMCFGMILVHPRVDPMNVDYNFLAIPKMPTLVFRSLMHGIDAAFLIGVIWMAVTQRRESIADKACNTIVLRPQDLDTLNIESGLIGARDRA